jgi:hypothetical protein
VLITTPLAVGAQTVREGEKFGVECERSFDGKFSAGARVVITNYERLHYFNPKDFAGMAADESSILKNFDGKTKERVTEFMRTLSYRSLWTATASPNDYIELGTSSEALGELGYMDMISRFFKAKNNSGAAHGGGGGVYGGKRSSSDSKFRFRGHAERDFWRWICSWARAIRKPSDLGCDDSKFILPKLETRQHLVKATTANPNYLFDMPAVGLDEQRAERKRTLKERCEMAAELVNKNSGPSISWCHLNPEGDLLEKLVEDCVQVSGSDSDEAKEEKILSFISGETKNLVTKSSICGFGLNMQHCAHQTHFPSHSFEQWYQAVRRSWRFGQKKKVIIDVITSEGEARVLQNLQRKSDAADKMFESLVELMNNELKIQQENKYTEREEIPTWL